MGYKQDVMKDRILMEALNSDGYSNAVISNMTDKQIDDAIKRIIEKNIAIGNANAVAFKKKHGIK